MVGGRDLGDRLGGAESVATGFGKAVGEVGRVTSDFPSENVQTGLALPRVSRVREFDLVESEEDVGVSLGLLGDGGHGQERSLSLGCVCGKMERFRD